MRQACSDAWFVCEPTDTDADAEVRRDSYLMGGRVIRSWGGLTSLWLHKPGGQPERRGK